MMHENQETTMVRRTVDIEHVTKMLTPSQLRALRTAHYHGHPGNGVGASTVTALVSRGLLRVELTERGRDVLARRAMQDAADY